MLIDIIGGARPNFVKIASLVHSLEKQRAIDSTISYRLVHTGQHYDAIMSGTFFSDLGIPPPDINLQVGSGTQAAQTGAIMVGYEKAIASSKPDLCLVVGDVTSTMACAITARKCGVAVAHVEAGIRSGDWGMPEEINRVVTDSITNWFYTTTNHASRNLIESGVPEQNVVFVGNTMIDTLLKHREQFVRPSLWVDLALQSGNYFVVTLHRPDNVDDMAALLQTLSSISSSANGLKVIFPVHPRTKAVLSEHVVDLSNVFLVEPLRYLEFNYLVSEAKGVITDSGGITEETSVLGIPTITLRDSTERPETIEIGTNVLAGTDPNAIAHWMSRLLAGDWKSGGIPDKWDGKAGDRIVAHLLSTVKT